MWEHKDYPWWLNIVQIWPHQKMNRILMTSEGGSKENSPLVWIPLEINKYIFWKKSKTQTTAHNLRVVGKVWLICRECSIGYFSKAILAYFMRFQVSLFLYDVLFNSIRMHKETYMHKMVSSVPTEWGVSVWKGVEMCWAFDILY